MRVREVVAVEVGHLDSLGVKLRRYVAAQVNEDELAVLPHDHGGLCIQLGEGRSHPWEADDQFALAGLSQIVQYIHTSRRTASVVPFSGVRMLSEKQVVFLTR